MFVTMAHTYNTGVMKVVILQCVGLHYGEIAFTAMGGRRMIELGSWIDSSPASELLNILNLEGDLWDRGTILNFTWTEGSSSSAVAGGVVFSFSFSSFIFSIYSCFRAKCSFISR